MGVALIGCPLFFCVYKIFDNTHNARYNKWEMKTSEFTRQISKLGCYIKRHGKKHDIWAHPITGGETQVNRHGSQELSPGIVDGMLKKLGLK